MYYTVTIAFENEEETRGGELRIKTQKVKYIFEALSVEEASILANKYIAEDSRTAEVRSIVDANIECVIDNANTPKYYKNVE